MFRTITAKYAGICRRCNGPIAIGQQIRFGGYGKAYHFAADCQPPATTTPQPAAIAPPSDNDLMNATIAASLQQTFKGLMQQPARIVAPMDEPTQPETAQPEPTAATPTAPIVMRNNGPITWSGQIGTKISKKDARRYKLTTPATAIASLTDTF